MGSMIPLSPASQVSLTEVRQGLVWRWLRGFSTRGRVLGAIALVAACVTLSGGYYFLDRSGNEARAMLNRQAAARLDDLVQDISAEAQEHDYPAIEQKLQASIKAGDLLKLSFARPQEPPIHLTMPGVVANRPAWFAELVGLRVRPIGRPLMVGDTNYGQLSLIPSPLAHEDYLWHLMLSAVLWVLAALALLGGTVSYLLRASRKDLLDLQQAARRIELGDDHSPIALRPGQAPELRATAEAFNAMSLALQDRFTKLKHEKNRWEVTLSSINDGVVVTDQHNRVVYLNAAAEVMLETPYEVALTLQANTLLRLNDPEQDELFRFVQAAVVPGNAATGSICLTGPAGRSLTLSCSCAPFSHRHDRGAIYVLRDETARKQQVENLRLLAFHDSLTSLPNRRAVEGRLERALRTARKDDLEHVFCYIDLDQFKLINDTCGHSAGDLLLASLAKSMLDQVPANAYLGRLGGDEFGLILFDAHITQARAVCHRLIRSIQGFRFNHNNRSFSVGACAGISVINAASRSLEDVMIQADMACYRSKAEGSGLIRVYEADEIGFRRLQEEMGLAAEFTQALEAGRFVPYRQLIQAVSPQGQSHYEVLIRVKRAGGEVDGPGKLLPALERYGQAPILDRWMLEHVIAYLSRQPQDETVYFINLSGKTLADENFLETAFELLDRHELPGYRIGFEITETAAVVNLASARKLIEGLRARGCRFGLDDFGREASSFSYLKHLPADYIKIDGSFVHRMVEDKQDQAIVRSIIQLSKDFGLRSVAEHVEHEATAVMLAEMGVDYLQGYHIHRPEPLPLWDISRLPAELSPTDAAGPAAQLVSCRRLT
jgi:diguanylate cyclase (GGDEF)-like protein